MKKSTLYLSVVCLCTVVCTFAFVAVNTNKNNQRKAEAIRASEEISQQLSKRVEEPPLKKEAEEPEKTIPVANNSIKTEAAPEKESSPPVLGGKIVCEYTDSVLVFNKTYGDYRTHNGIDIESMQNTPVMSVRKGVVIKNEYDYEDGYTVEIEHEDGIVSVYKNLESDKIVKVGQVVAAGETIGTVGTSAVSESHLQPHLHFEIKEDNVEIDPLGYISLPQ